MSILPKFLRPRAANGIAAIRVSPLLVETARLTVPDALERLQSTRLGLSAEQAEQRLEQHGPNVVAQEKRHSRIGLLGRAMVNPLVVLLLILAAISLLTEDFKAAVVMAGMVPVVFLINGLTKGNWHEAFFFALAVAVGMTPEMLPMIVTVCLSKGAIAMSRKKVIVKRLHSIQNFGAMDVLCTDKTGTLTLDRVIIEKHCDVVHREDDDVLAMAYLNSYFQTGLKNVLDRAVLDHREVHGEINVPAWQKVDEIPFDFSRRLMSVVVETPQDTHRIITKGAPWKPCASTAWAPRSSRATTNWSARRSATKWACLPTTSSWAARSRP